MVTGYQFFNFIDCSVVTSVLFYITTVKTKY